MKRPKRFKIETEEEWRARALRSQADAVRSALTQRPATAIEIRDSLNRKGHDFTELNVLTGLQSLEADGLAIKTFSGRWMR